MKIQFCKVALAAIVLFIFCNSALPGKISNGISDEVTVAVGGTVATAGTVAAAPAQTTAAPHLTSSVVRKLAHVTEFAALGLAGALLVLFKGKPICRQLPGLLLLGLSIGLLDETIQLFSKRSSMVADVWIDLAGFGMGVLAVGLLSAAAQRKRGEA